MRELMGLRSVASSGGAGESEKRTAKLLLAGVCWWCGISVVAAAGLGPRTGNDTLRMPPIAATSKYTTENAFGDLSFTFPMMVVTPPHETNRVFVVEQGGMIVVIPNLNQPARNVFLDIGDRISYGRPEDEGGILGLAFHPNYATNGYFYVYYLCNTATADGSGRHDRLSRFKRSQSDPNKADPNSEVILFSQYDEKFNHNGGTILFGPDGYLYLSLGDEGHPDDIYDNGQRIDKDFFSAVIRIDVDRRRGSLPPNSHPALQGKTNYWIPPDNPFVGATSFNGQPVDPARVRTEFYAVGIRSPWRMFWDVPTGNLYLSDVGENSGEEFNVIVKGGNYGWPYRLANGDGPKAAQAPAGFTSIPPLLTYDRGESGPTVGRAAIGGVVYRGARFPELNDAYICGDYYAGNVWKIRNSGNSLQEWTFLTALPQFHLVSFGTDPRNGDVLICDVADGEVKRLIPTPNPDLVPLTLADTGAFADLQTLEPNPGIVPYDINVPFWSDGAIKKRWFSIPNAQAKIRAHSGGRWTFPEGTVFIKHFELELVKGDPASRRRLETRFLVRNSEGVYGVTYRWNDAQDNATLVPEEGANATFTVNDNGIVRQQTWHFPSRNECLTCHNPVAGHVLGVNGPQMNRTFDYGTFSGNQVRALARAHYFSGGPSYGKKLVSMSNTRASRESRVRSYLSANCSQCHRPGGFGRALWDARYSTPRSRSGIINGGLTDMLGDPANRVIAPKSPEHSMILQRMITSNPNLRMPPLASNVADDDAMRLLTNWIQALPKRSVPLRVRITHPRVRTTHRQILSIRGTAVGDNLARIVYRLNTGEEQIATGANQWSAEIILAPGVNYITAYAEDNAGKRSPPARKRLRYVDDR
jgi:uncharacterized repeat protein (TIGR03806 family)